MNHQSPQLTQAFKLKGYLDKKSSQLLVGWQSRYWAVVGIDLLYYHDNTEKDIKGKFIVKKIQSLQEEDKKVFSFVYDDRKYELRAKTMEERDSWVRGLRAIKKYVGEDIISEPNSPTKIPQMRSNSSLRDFSDILSAQEEAYIIISEEMQDCKAHSDVIKNLGLKDLASKFSTKRISSRIAIAQTKDSYLVVLSWKSLMSDYEDGDILSQQQINPFQLNTLYKVKIGSEKVKQVCKTSSVFSAQYEDSQKLLKINCGKRIQFQLREKQKYKENNNQFLKRLKRAAEVGRQYHNTKNISLNANIGPLTKLYETNQGSELKQKTKIYLQNKYSTLLKSLHKDFSNLSSFCDYLQHIILFEKDYLNAFQVSNTKIPLMVSDFEQFIHHKVHQILVEYWDKKYHTLSSQDVLQLARTIDQYRRITNKYAKDHILDNGIGTLVKIHLRSLKQRLIKEIQRLRTSLSSASFSVEIYNFLYRELSRIVSHCQSQQALTQVVEFMDDCYTLWIEQMRTMTQKQTNPQNLVLSLSEINDFNTKVFTELKDYILNNGLDALSFDDSLNQTQIITAQKNLTLHIIQRLFRVLFSNIDRNFVSQSFMKINFYQLIKQIDKKVDGLKNMGKDELKEIRREIANQLLQFELNLILQYKPDPKDKIEHIVKKINEDRCVIEKQFLKVVDKSTLEKQMTVLLDLTEFLSQDSLISIRKHFKQLKKSLPCLFTLVTAKSLLELKTHLSKQQRSKLYSVCVDILSSQTEPSQVYQISKKQSMLESFALSSRRSTLTLSIERHVSTRPANDSIAKQSISGYLKKKKIDKRSIKRIYERRYFTILEGHLLWYLNESSVELHNKIDLRHLKLVGLHESKKDVFFLHLEDCAYQFKAESNQLCRQWVRILKSYVVSNPYETEAITIYDDTELFKDYDSHPCKSAPKLLRLQSTRQSVLSQMTDKSKQRERNSPSPSSPPKSPTKSNISKIEQLTTERNANAPFIKKQSLNVEHRQTEGRGCWRWFKRCLGGQ